MSKTHKNHKNFKKAKVRYVDNLELDFQVLCGEIILDKSKARRAEKKIKTNKIIEEGEDYER